MENFTSETQLKNNGHQRKHTALLKDLSKRLETNYKKKNI